MFVMIAATEGWSRHARPDILPNVRGTLWKALVRATRRAALLTTLSLAVAVTIGVGGFLASHEAQQALASVIPTAVTGSLPAHTTAFALAATTRDNAAEAARGSVPLSEQPFEHSRVVTAETPAVNGSEDVVRANRLVAPVGTPALHSGDRIKVSVSFYYCELGGSSPSRGDGGGFCGAMRDGSVVYNGAAACDVAYLGQRFRIDGDPLGRIYRCADTGSAVHGLHRDIWFNSSDEGWKWQKSVGQAATIEILP
jgi:hypothetical protein